MFQASEGTQGVTACRLASAVAIAFALLLAGIMAVNVLTELQRARRANAAVDTIAVTNVLLDDLQRERSEAIYLTVAPSADMTDYAERTATTDATIATLAASPLFANGMLSAHQQDLVAENAAELRRLADLRASVRARIVSAPDTAEGYTAINDALIDTMAAMFDALSGGVSHFSEHFRARAMLHDRAALETAVGYTGFALGEMPEPLHGVFVEAIAAQAEQHEHHRAIAGPAEEFDFDALLARTGTAELQAAREALHAASTGQALDPAHRAIWSNTMAPRVTDLAVERNRFAREQLEQLAALSQARLRHALFRAGLAFAALLLAVGAVRYALKRLARSRRPSRRAAAQS